MKAVIKSRAKNYPYPMVELQDVFIEVNGKQINKLMPCKMIGNYILGTVLDGNIVTIPKYLIEGEDDIGKIRNYNEKLLSKKEVMYLDKPVACEGSLEIFWPNFIPYF